jgi:hypothetical protein
LYAEEFYIVGGDFNIRSEHHHEGKEEIRIE